MTWKYIIIMCNHSRYYSIKTIHLYINVNIKLFLKKCKFNYYSQNERKLRNNQKHSKELSDFRFMENVAPGTSKMISNHRKHTNVYICRFIVIKEKFHPKIIYLYILYNLLHKNNNIMGLTNFLISNADLSKNHITTTKLFNKINNHYKKHQTHNKKY